VRHDPYRSADYQENDQKSEGKGQHDNAIRHNARNVRLEAVADGATVNMTVSNDGDPISGPNRDKIFDAFFTTRRDTGGTGMGLAIVQAVMTSHGGSIRLLPRLAWRSSFSFRPRKAGSAASSDPLDDDRGRHVAGGAHRHQAALEVATLQFVEDGPDQASMISASTMVFSSKC